MQASRVLVRCSALVFSLAAVGAAHAVQLLQGRDINGTPVAPDAATAVMEYDPNLNITWLRDWNAKGAMNWNAAKTWASGLTVGTFGGWSLPSALNQDGSGPCGPASNCTGSQMGYMYYTELGNVAFPEAGYGMSNKGPFQNVQSNFYWSGTGSASAPGSAWFFRTDFGFQGSFGTNFEFYAVAVRPGDVAGVPEAQTWALMLAGLGAVAVALRRRPG